MKCPWSKAWGGYVLDKAEWHKDVAKSPDPQEEVLKEIYNEEEWEWDGGPDGRFSKGDLIAFLVMALQRNASSIMIYKRSLSSLIGEVRAENDDCLFVAIRLDRTIVTGPIAAARISKAELLGEKRFFQRLLKALKGPSKKHWEGHKDLRYSLAALRDLGLQVGVGSAKTAGGNASSVCLFLPQSANRSGQHEGMDRCS